MVVQADVLSRQEVLAVREGLAAAPFRAGRVTAGAAAERVKNNEQAPGDDPGVIALSRRVRLALEAHSRCPHLGPARPLVELDVRALRPGPAIRAAYGQRSHVRREWLAASD